MSEADPRQRQQQRPPTARIPEDELVLLRDLADQHKQELKLAQIAADRDVSLERAQNGAIEAKYESRELRYYVMTAVVIVSIVALFFFTLIRWIHVSDAHKQEKLQQLHEQTVQECIHAGNIWVSNSCILSGKS